MMKHLEVAIIQSNLVWENPIQNRLDFSRKIEEIDKQVDLIVLPEMFTTGFTMNPNIVAENMTGNTVDWMKQMAEETQAAIMGSLVISENNDFFNRLLFVEPSGTFHIYDKRHTFTLAGEHLVYSAGKKHTLVEYKGWHILPLICYDLRFPVWSRNTMDYDLLIYVANWPRTRIAAWDALLKARAIENMSYCIGVNRVGLDANNLEYPGHSAVYDLFGNVTGSCTDEKEETVLVTLSKDHLKNYRQKLQFLKDRDKFSLK
ncbi:MAG: amidohydrolase [Bacteroidia bacterium]|nr:amidohydrolase [Bacteroidia bacterium]NND09719.1 amidohydrolase [Flavobacteriaceae bacterium]NNK28213.1 amidohydrolase [Flavobacteriaceae bacterium]RZV68273.1 MAG: amidohydrolase [Flavobacteriaceae bacterium]